MPTPKPTNSIKVPLYSRASDRSIEECNFRWHAERSGRVEIAAASWFDIGTAMHNVYERGIQRKWKTVKPYRTHAVKEVTTLVSDGLMGSMAAGVNYLTSKHRPIDDWHLETLAEELAESFFENVIENPPAWLPDVYSDHWLLEHNVRIPSNTPHWDFEAGASTTIDALWGDTRNFLLVDWKTGRSRSSDPRQLQFYRYLLELQGWEASTSVWGAFFHAEYGTWQIVEEYNPDEVEHLIATSQNLKKARPEPRPSWLCDYCPAREICPSWADDPYEAELLQQIADYRRTSYVYELDPPPVS